MKTATLVVSGILLTFSAQIGNAEPAMDPAAEQAAAVEETLRLFLAQNSDTEIGALRVTDLRSLLEDVSVLQQQAEYVRATAGSSFAAPGVGHMTNGAAGIGTLIGAGHLAITAGILVGSHLLLPESVQIGTIDYFGDSFASIESAWKDLSFTDLLPSMGVMAGGAIIDLLYRGFAAKSAGNLARERVASGAVEFEPQLSVFLGPGGMPMVGMHHSF